MDTIRNQDTFPRNSVTELFKGMKKRFKHRKTESRMIFKVRYAWHHLFSTGNIVVSKLHVCGR
jgi:hypothetical protein